MTTRTLPIHPRTGLLALGLLTNGRPIWPVLGGSEGAPEGGGGDGGAGTNGDAGKPGQPPVTFTQADVDRIVSERLARDRGKFADYDDLKTKAAEFDKLAEAQKTEAQKQQEALEEALGKASRTEVDLWRERAARTHGLDDELMAFLTGETAEEVEARAKTLALKLKPEPGKRPAPDRSQGRGTDGKGTGGSVAAGRELYQQRRGKKTS